MWEAVHSYLAIRPRERHLHRSLGVHRFARFVPFGYWMNRAVALALRRPFRIVRDAKSARVWVLFTVVVEAAHVTAFVAIAVRSVASAVSGDWGSAGSDALVNAVVNGYPSLVQRYNRDRLVRIFRLRLESLPSWRL